MKTRAAIACLFVMVVCAALARRVPDVIDRPLLTAIPGAPVGVPLPFASADGRESRRDIALRVRDTAELGRYDQIQIFFGTFETSPALQYGWLQIDGTGCSFQAPAQRLTENGRIVFNRAGTCGSGAGGPARATLRLAMAGPARYARAAVWTSPPAPGTVPLLTIDAYGQVMGVAGRAIVRRSGPPVRRIELLAFMWELDTRIVWSLVAAAGALIVLGAAFLSRRGRAATAAASFAITAGIALLQAVVVPPLQSPDEPDHLLEFAQVAGRPALAAAESAWAKRIHFYRLTFMPDERFTPADRERAFDRDWPVDVFAEDVTRRSSSATRLWRVLAPLAARMPAHALLSVRCVDAVLFGLAFAGGAALLAAAGTASMPTLLAPVMLALPTLPFFGMQMSEMTLTICGLILLGYGTVLVIDGAPPRLSGPALGLSVALMAAGPRNGWPSLLIVAALAAGQLFTTSPGRASRLVFWGGLALPSLVLFGSGALWVPSPAYDAWQLTGWDPRGSMSTGPFLLLLTAAALGGGLAEILLARAGALTRSIGRVMQGVAAACAIWIVAVLAWSIWAPLPMVTPVERVAPASAAAYVRSTLLALGTWPRVQGFDFLTWTSLWGAFGWADTILPAFVIAAVTVGAAGAAVIALSRAARDGDRAARVVAGLAGTLAAAATAAVFSYAMSRNLHGRYLLGACVTGIVLLIAPAAMGRGREMSPRLALFVLAIVLSLHGYALSFLLGRYFG